MSGNHEGDGFANLFPDVKRLEQDRVAPYRDRRGRGSTEKPPAPRRHFEPAPFEEAPESWHAGGLRHTVLRRFRRGELRPEARLDLHGYPRDRGQRMLESFIDRAAEHGARCVLVIHGKGTRSEHSVAVMRQMTRAILRQHDRVIAYSSAQPKDGGTGAVYVFLRAVK